MNDNFGSLPPTRRSIRAGASLSLLTAAAVLAGCVGTNTADQSATTSVTPVSVSESADGSGARYSIEDLGMGFDLPEHFGEVDDDELLFLARSSAPPAILSIDREAPDVTQHEGEDGESVRSIQLGDADAVIVSNAVVEGLPPGIAANELLVDNGTQSFSVIMSAAQSELADLWEAFIASVQVEPA